MATHVIVGASLAGAKAAEAMREHGFEGRIVLVGDERERPYERPPLSKGFLKGDEAKDKVYVHPERWYADHDVELRLAVTVTGLHRTRKEIDLAGGERVGYDRLLLVTGSSPRKLTVPGADLAGVHYLRRLGDSERLREVFGRGGALVVVGGGWIGLEVAAAARHHGVEVTLIEPQPAPLHAALGREVGEIFAALHRRHGVDVRTGSGVTTIEGADGKVTGVQTTTGQLVAADAVVVGVGVTPNVRLGEAAGLEVDNGIVVDERLQTSDGAIWAAGDVANAFHPLLDQQVRVEHWANASNQGTAAGAAMAAQADGKTTEPYTKLPYFFTDQYDLSMEYHGHVGRGGYDDVVLRGDPASGSPWLAFWLRQGRVLAGMNVNDWDAADAIKALVRSRAVVDRDQLADPSTPLPTPSPPR
ncbi:MAG: 3-phenylpropionate/trans-cinnamate dioxygenase ferredoxin reductase component [Actinomycetota bacterium]|nr:3-phenylpropionate/trans-cinnamate dioxygenase ferredoxin reductase component [Actinomycetota bacterium]